MDFSFSEEQRAAQSLAEDLLAPNSASKRDAPAPPSGDEWFDRETWRVLAEANLLGLGLAEDVGGSGLSFTETCAVLEVQGRHLARVPLADTSAVAAPAIDIFGSAALRSAVLPRVVSGDAVLSAALVEPRGYDPTRLETVATADGAGGWSITGEKLCVPFARDAERVLVPARVGENDVAVFAVDPRTDGVQLERAETTNGQPEFRMVLTDARVGGDDVLSGAPGSQVLAWLLDHSTVAACAVQLGVAEQALQMTAAYTSEREQFGRPIATFQAVAMQAADAYIAVECIRSTLWQAAWCLATGRPVEQAVSVAKYWASDGGQKVTAIAQHLHGGIGVDTDYPLHRYTLWSKHNELHLGGGHAQLARIGAALAHGTAE